ncbi:MAG TPA: hypothetical protein VGO13_08905 [Solirubrobacterales bacterium]|jgi:hypothetical protein|nr:hypothetical protein [Solirubrobacterales bacterium]
MSRDLIVLLGALALGAVVAAVGMRRNLSETTRDWLPRFGGDTERATMAVGLYEGGERPRRPLSPRQRRSMALFYLLLALTNLAFAVLSADGRLFHAAIAALWVLSAALLLLRKWPHHSA